ncbi:magnesium transporter [Methylomarinovum caldicuralii]|nr:magnesium transporter [Methylomarinovum caldicuralii]
MEIKTDPDFPPREIPQDDPEIGSLTVPAPLVIRGDEPLASVLERCRQDASSCLRAPAVVVCDDQGRYLGLLLPEDLDPDSASVRAKEKMRPVPAVSMAAAVDEVVQVALDHGVGTVAVADQKGRLQGLIPPPALLKLLHHAHIEDMNRFVGIWKNNTEQALNAIEGNPIKRAWHRLPWLLVGTAGSVLATGLMTDFETELKAQVAVAFFIPGLVYLADAIGTQSEAIAVRGLSFSRASLVHLWLGETVTGLLLGFILAGLLFPLIWLTFGLQLALAVCTALVAASAFATSIGLLFPWVLSRLGLDPAFGSGPVATIVQDILSLAVYLMTVRWML